MEEIVEVVLSRKIEHLKGSHIEMEFALGIIVLTALDLSKAVPFWHFSLSFCVVIFFFFFL